MSKIEVTEQLASRFSQPLSPFCARRIVIWHDPDGEFEEAFEALAAEGFSQAGTQDGVMPAHGPFERPIRFVRAEDGVMFATKKLICRDDTQSDVLLYRKRAKGAIEGDWLADVELYAESFQADYFSLLAVQIGAADVDAVRDALREFKGFFAAKARIKRFCECMPEPACAEDVERGVLASLLGAARPDDASAGFIVREYLASLSRNREQPDQAFEPFRKYGAADALSRCIARRTGFSGPLDEASSFRELASHVLVSAASFLLPAGALSGLERCVSQQHAPFCLSIVRDWDRNGDAAELYETCRIVEDACGLRERFSQLAIDDIVDCDVFPCVNDVILARLMTSVSEDVDCAATVRQVTSRRRNLAWSGYVSRYFDLLDAAASLSEFKREHAGGFHLAQPKDVWRAYETDWYRADTFYRRLCCAFESCKLSDRQMLEEPVRSIADWAERLYANWFLDCANACWENAAQSQWADAGHVEGVPLERRFYWETLPSCTGAAKNTVVIISDALRFEVAKQIADELERERGAEVSLSSMQAVFPSITEFGMAALLPQRELSFDWETGAVFAGDMPTATIDQREKALQTVKREARALRAEDFLALRSDERKALVKDACLVYLYHNKIDSIGEKAATESDVFKACDDTIEYLRALAKRIVSEVPGCHVAITADHGFLYTRGNAQECGSLSMTDAPGASVASGKRHVVLHDKEPNEALEGADDPSGSLFIEMNMNDVAGGHYMGLAPRRAVRIKQSGGTRRYVHGGLSLQELCVPVLTFSRARSGSKGFKDTENAQLRVLSESRRITNSLFTVSLLQEQPARGKVLPCAFELVFVDSSGNEVSDVVKANADFASDNPQDRVIKVRFTLKAGLEFDAKQTYYLIAREKQTGSQAWREEYRIEVAFAPVDDFGF